MKPTKLLAKTTTIEGEVLELVSHDNNYQIRSGGFAFFSSHSSNAERVLGKKAVEPFLACRKPRILIGGLGLGHIAKSVVDTLARRRGEITVAEPCSDIIRWHHTHLRDFHGEPPLINDPRLHILPKTIEETIWAGQDQHAIVIRCGGAPRNETACAAATLAAAYQALLPKGLLCVLSPVRDKEFDKELQRCGFEVASMPVQTCEKARRPRLASLWLAKKA